jgi:hypothetical protein
MFFLLVAFAIFSCRGSLLCPSGNSFRGSLPQHPTGKIALLSGCCNARDWVFVMSMAPDCATFDTIFGYFWLNLFVYFYFRKSVWLESLVGLFRQNLVQWALELGQFECWARILLELV